MPDISIDSINFILIRLQSLIFNVFCQFSPIFFSLTLWHWIQALDISPFVLLFCFVILCNGIGWPFSDCFLFEAGVK